MLQGLRDRDVIAVRINDCAALFHRGRGQSLHEGRRTGCRLKRTSVERERAGIRSTSNSCHAACYRGCIERAAVEIKRADMGIGVVGCLSHDQRTDRRASAVLNKLAIRRLGVARIVGIIGYHHHRRGHNTRTAEDHDPSSVAALSHSKRTADNKRAAAQIQKGSAVGSGRQIDVPRNADHARGLIQRPRRRIGLAHIDG